MAIIFIHGLARTSLSLLGLEWRLRTKGHKTVHFGYAAFAESFDQIVERLWRCLQVLEKDRPYSAVTHSLGGVLLRAALGRGGLSHPQQIVMLAPPNQRPRLALLAWNLFPFRWVTGQCGFNLTQSSFYANLPPLQSPYTIIAGTGGLRGPLSPFGNEPNDGIVALSETRLTTRDRLVQLPVEHTFMMHDPAVHRIVSRTLASSSCNL